jgi:putative endonuclease
MQAEVAHRSTTRVGGPHLDVQASVYIIRSRSVSTRYYTDLTSDVAARLAAHNAGRCTHTLNGRPWELVVVIEFAVESRAIAFEKHLKSGSGVAFSMRHFR